MSTATEMQHSQRPNVVPAEAKAQGIDLVQKPEAEQPFKEEPFNP